MNRDYYVYRHIFPNNKVYVGLSHKDPILRWHKDGGAYKEFHFYDDILKYGWDNIKHEIVYSGLTREEASEKEKELIKYYKDLGLSYNINCGGTCGPYNIYHLNIDGVSYNSNQISEMIGNSISPKAISTRIKRNWDTEKILNQPMQERNHVYEYNGEQYTVEELYEIRINKDLALLNIRDRLNRGWDVERAITQPTNVKLQPFGSGEKKYYYNGEYLNSHELFLLRKDKDITRHDITNRIKEGWSIEDAITKPPKIVNEKYNYNGTEYTINELLDFSTVDNMTYDVLYARIKRYKWDVTKALTTEVKKKGVN